MKNKGKITSLGSKEIKEEIIFRMNALYIASEDYSNEEIISDFVGLIKKEAEDKIIKLLRHPDVYNKEVSAIIGLIKK